MRAKRGPHTIFYGERKDSAKIFFKNQTFFAIIYHSLEANVFFSSLMHSLYYLDYVRIQKITLFYTFNESAKRV